MPIITRTEVKRLLKLVDSYTTGESITFSSVAQQKITNGPNVNIIFISADNLNSTKSTRYTTLDYYTTKRSDNYTNIKRIDTGNISDTETVYITYTYNDYDEYIDYLIPQIQDDLMEYLNYPFLDKQTKYDSGSLKFLSSGPYITDSNQRLSSEGFTTDMDIYVDRTRRNWGIYSITSLTDSVITLSSNDSIIAEQSSKEYGAVSPRLTRIKWPTSIKPLVAQIIWFNIDRAKNSNVKSKSLGPSSVTYANLNSGAYPDHIYRGLKKYRLAKMR